MVRQILLSIWYVPSARCGSSQCDCHHKSSNGTAASFDWCDLFWGRRLRQWYMCHRWIDPHLPGVASLKGFGTAWYGNIVYQKASCNDVYLMNVSHQLVKSIEKWWMRTVILHMSHWASLITQRKPNQKCGHVAVPGHLSSLARTPKKRPTFSSTSWLRIGLELGLAATSSD